MPSTRAAQPAGFVVTERGTGSGEHRDVDTVPG